ncbi:MAG: VapB-type antitoxin [Sulfolobus sp.]
MKIVTIKVKDEYYEIAEQMVEMGLAKSKNEAFNLIMSYGINKAVEEIERKKKVKELTEKWLKEGLPFELPTPNDVISDREQF